MKACKLHFHVISDFHLDLPTEHKELPAMVSKGIAKNTALILAEDCERYRRWLYDTGCRACAIGRCHLTAHERRRIFQVPLKTHITASGMTSTTEAVMCDIPYLGQRFCYVLEDCPPALSVHEGVEEYGNVLYWDKVHGPSIYTADGRTIQLDTSNQVLELTNDCEVTSDNGEAQGTETFSMVAADPMVCMPCGVDSDQGYAKQELTRTAEVA